ncbi:IS1595 family transposase [bioreactor metagenome]|uniref:IS1595 family transposase n=1 Tax=bioreactor metagenome TaxID=1076179 RepID=A0A645BKA6_9ZZZZ
MNKQNVLIQNIPAIIWGEKGSKMFVAVHGNMSNKSDTPICILAEEAVSLGYQVLSFDLPQHGDRKHQQTLCKVQNCVHDLSKIVDFAKMHSPEISLFACSMGAYFSLLAYKDITLKQSLFLSPVVDMSRIIDNMMTWFQISKEQLKAEQEILTPIGETLYWDYYCYTKENPIVSWANPTSILYGKEDNLCEFDFVSSFANKFDCALDVMESGEHYFHTPEQLNYFRQWLKKHLTKKG